ncbi:MAG: putative photosynthetic complex assembly protein PuhE [Paracoccaceae bacterium]
MTLAALSALFIWWFSTGAILWAIGRNPGNTAVWASLPLALVAAVWLAWASQQGTIAGAYAGFAAAILVWGWFEFAFLTGVLTGPNRQPCPPCARGWQHFGLAWATVSHHELAILGTATLLGILTWNAPDQTGLWTFLILFAARISAKLNVYFGVPNLSHEMMPESVAHMKTYFANRSMNWLFPVSITALTFANACWIERAVAATPGSGAEIGFVLLATLTSLALLEHWLMVLPVRDALLWRWMTPKPKLESAVRATPAE